MHKGGKIRAGWVVDRRRLAGGRRGVGSCPVAAGDVAVDAASVRSLVVAVVDATADAVVVVVASAADRLVAGVVPVCRLCRLFGRCRVGRRAVVVSRQEPAVGTWPLVSLLDCLRHRCWPRGAELNSEEITHCITGQRCSLSGGSFDPSFLSEHKQTPGVQVGYCQCECPQVPGGRLEHSQAINHLSVPQMISGRSPV